MREFADRDGIVAWWRRVVAPTAEGLPSWRVIAAPLVIVALIFITIVSLGFTGSSTESCSISSSRPQGREPVLWPVFPGLAEGHAVHVCCRSGATVARFGGGISR